MVINKKLQKFELIYLKKLLLVILIVIELMFQTSYWNNVNSIFGATIGMFACCR